MSSIGSPIAIPVGSGNIPNLPSYSDLSNYNVNRDGWEVIRQTLYDSNAYAAAGAQLLTFFALPIGQGTGFGGAAKNLSDTNMVAAGQMPNMQEFLIQSVEVAFFPTTPTVAAQMPAVFGAQAAALIVNDAYIFYRAGNFQLQIGSKNYLTEAPLMKFPPKAYFELHGALSDGTTLAGASQNRLAFGISRGRPYLMNGANLRLVSNQNFSATLNWPEGVQAISNPARVFVYLDGLLYRRSQ
jgi:hypothetical protein